MASAGQARNCIPARVVLEGAKRTAVPVSSPRHDMLDKFRRDAELTQEELWLRYFELGGMSSALQLEAFLFGALNPSPYDHDVIAHALNERFVELGGNHPVPYVHQDQRD
jgi:hypothetical protein